MNIETQLQALLQQNRIKDAVALCRLVLSSSPDSFPALDFMARLALQQGDRVNARAYVQRILNSPADIDRVMYLKLLGEICGQLKDWDGSLTAYREVLELVPRELEARVNVANLQLRLGQYPDAQASAELLFEHIQSGGLSELASAKSALGMCVYRVADLLKESRASVALETFLPLKDTAECGFLNQDFNYWYGLGALQDALSDHERALECFRQANALRRAQAPFDATQVITRIENILTSFGKSFFDAPPVVEVADDVVPIFIVGMPRTGSTLVEQILGRHSAVKPLGELEALNTSLGEVVNKGGQGRWDFSRPASLDAGFFHAVRDAYLSRCGSGGARYFTDKMPWNLMHVWLVAKAFPNARVIYTQRDMLATVMSCFTTNFGNELRFTESIEDSARVYSVFERAARTWEPLMGGRMIIQRYEDLTRDPGGEIPKLLDFLKLEFEPACLEPHKSERTVSTASMFQVTRPIYSTGDERWQPYRSILGPDAKLLG